MTWQVQVEGDPWDLDYLIRLSEGSRWRFLRDVASVGYLYESDTLAALATSDEVERVARDELACLSGILKLERDSREPLRQRAIFRVSDDGGRDAFVRAQGFRPIRFGTPSMLQTDAAGNALPEQTVQSRAAAILQVAAGNIAVSKVLRLLSAADAESWVGLYRVHEVIEADVGGQHTMQTKGWTSADDLKRFKHSANSVHVGGDGSRHGRELQLPPKNPMNLPEAAAYVAKIMRSWLASKVHEAV
jgi:hypothetical protein